MNDNDDNKPNRPDKIQSVSTAIRILEVLAEAAQPLALGEIARRTKIGNSSAHRQIQSLLDGGMVQQEGPNMPYALGRKALQIGLAAARRIDPLESAASELKALCDCLAVSGGIAVWTNNGPTLVRWYRSEVFSIASVKLGDVLPLDKTACGLTFQAFLPRREIEAVRAQQPEAFRGTPPSSDLLQEIRARQGFSLTGHLEIGVTGQAAALFDPQGEISCVMTIVAGLGFSEDPEHMQALFDAAARINS